jgi:hypothetical protein
MWDYYQVGPVQKAVLTDLLHDVIEAVLDETVDEVKYEYDLDLDWTIAVRVKTTFGMYR